MRVERADPRRRTVHQRRGRALAKKPSGKAVRGGRDPQKKKVPAAPEDLSDEVDMFVVSRMQYKKEESVSCA